MIMKNKTVVILLTLVVLLIAVTMWWKHSGKETVKNELQEIAPEIHVSKMNITDIDPEEIHMMTETVIENHLPSDLNIDSLQYTVFVDSMELVESTYPKPLLIKKSDSASIKLPVTIKMKQFKSLMDEFDKDDRDSADYTINAKFKMKVPIAGKREFALHFTRRLPAIRAIEVKPKDVDIDKFGFKESDIGMQVSITNKNVFPIRIRNGRFNISVEKDFEAEGKMEPVVFIPAKGTENVSMSMAVKTAKVPKLGWKMLFRQEQTNFKMNFAGELLSSSEIINNSKMKMHASGTIDDLKNLSK
jgi:LEA14-like dessication related protein